MHPFTGEDTVVQNGGRSARRHIASYGHPRIKNPFLLVSTLLKGFWRDEREKRKGGELSIVWPVAQAFFLGGEPPNLLGVPHSKERDRRLDPLPPSMAVFPCKMCFLHPSISWVTWLAGLNAYPDRGHKGSLQATLQE